MIQKHMVKCPICRNYTIKTFELLFLEILGISKKYNMQLYFCKNCNYFFVSNYLKESILKSYYKNLSNYEADNITGEVANDKILMSKKQYEFIKNENLIFNTVLDIGAATGFNLNTYKKKNYNVFGIEPSPNNVKYAKNRYDIDLYCGTFESYIKTESPKNFDLIILSHILEHVSNPIVFLNNISNVNNKYLFIEVPTLNYVIQGEPFGIFYYEHIGYYTVECLSYLMNEIGYKPISISIDFNLNGISPHYPTLKTLWQKGKGEIIKGMYNPYKIFKEYINESKKTFKRIEKKIDMIKSKKLAVWGTGSHTSRLLGQTNLKYKNIIKFYDSDKKKHNYKMVEKEITEFKIDDIKNNIVDTILISTFCGEKSIKKYLNDLDLNIDIILLYD